MTVSTTVNRAQYDGNGATTVFPYPFRILEDSHLVVTVIDSAENETTLTQDTDYTISGVGRYNGGYITLTGGALATGKTISLDRVVPDTQEASIRNQGSYLPEIHENALDKLTMIIQGVVSTLFGRALLKPSWLAKYYDAKGNRIANMASPVNAQDAATKNYVDAGDTSNNQHVDDLFKRTLRVPESSVNQLSPASGRKNSLLGFNNSGNPVPIFSWTETADLALKLASDEDGLGDALLAVKQPFYGAAARTQHDKNAEFVSVTDFSGALPGRGNDSSSAFASAYETGRFVYVPAGDWFTSVHIPNKTFGEGRIWCDGDGLFPDAGERVVTPGVSHQRQYLYRATTWGNRERAAGWSLMVNNEDGRPAVSGFTSDNAMANYVNFDHVGLFVSMRGSRKFFYTTAANTTYTEFTVTAPEITSEQEVKPGMLISTSHSPRFKGRVMAVDFDTNTITVSRWVAEGNGADGQIPASGVRALINGADKLWAANFNLFIDANSPAKTGCGLEIDIISDGTHGNPVEGCTVVNANNLGNPFNYGFRAIGNWLYTVYADAKQNVGLLHNEPPTSAVRVDNLSSASWGGAAVILNTNYRQASSYLAKIITGGVAHFSIDSRGQRSVQREAYGVVNTSVTLNGRSPGEISCTNDVAVEITITLSSENCVPGQIFNIRARDGSVLVAGFTLNNTNGRFISILYDGATFIKRFQTN